LVVYVIVLDVSLFIDGVNKASNGTIYRLKFYRHDWFTSEWRKER